MEVTKGRILDQSLISYLMEHINKYIFEIYLVRYRKERRCLTVDKTLTAAASWTQLVKRRASCASLAASPRRRIWWESPTSTTPSSGGRS
ncbi:hypothetical protein DPMN_074020 [Dreissena polymorpha]|uniref:Uncharacterized protein n=1 Tax=Dreissena polymorpha TaxID=45954 RepID=A0A9D3YFG3_DREPO|nr:hypothetical protein DPMN_074020 [Dreissena polymorpha]